MAGENAGLTIQLNTIFAKQSNCYCCAISFFFLGFPLWWHFATSMAFEASPEVRISVLSNFVVFQRVVEITFESCHPVRTWSWHHLALYKVPWQSPTPGTMNWNSAVKGEKFWRNSPKVEGIKCLKWLNSDFQETFLGQKKWGPLRGLDTMVGCIYYSWTQKHKKPSAIIWKMSSGVKFFGICLREDTESMRIEDAGVYKLCWCHVGSQSDCSRLEDFNVEAGRISSQISLLQGHWGG